MKTKLLFLLFALILTACSTPTDTPIKEQVSGPVFNLASNTYDHDLTITIVTQTTGAFIFYTTDGSRPSSNSNLYTDPIMLSDNGTTTINNSNT